MSSWCSISHPRTWGFHVSSFIRRDAHVLLNVTSAFWITTTCVIDILQFCNIHLFQQSKIHPSAHIRRLLCRKSLLPWWSGMHFWVPSQRAVKWRIGWGRCGIVSYTELMIGMGHTPQHILKNWNVFFLKEFLIYVFAVFVWRIGLQKKLATFDACWCIHFIFANGRQHPDLPKSPSWSVLSWIWS